MVKEKARRFHANWAVWRSPDHGGRCVSSEEEIAAVEEEQEEERRRKRAGMVKRTVKKRKVQRLK